MPATLDRNTALVLIDLQKGAKTFKAAHPIKGVLEKSARLVAAFRDAGLPIVVVTVYPFGAAWLKTRKDSPPIPNNKLVQALLKGMMNLFGFFKIADEIHTQPSDIFIVKKTWNAFFDTPLHAELQKRSVTGVVLAGVSTSIGVEGTARAAHELGYTIHFVADAMTDMKLAQHESSLRNIFPRLGQQGTAAELIEKLPSIIR